ncbi:MAG: 4Fe-4S dicluster domain-containing protein [Reichenbachiella sp.]|uniref:4Fe-4S dicluster domain-containing protein n=1 Tax=Reichenbachiella sp. TaxID=2184521 RepID=UPI0032669DE9
MRYAMAIDTKKCIGCADCVLACNMENQIPEGFTRSWVVEMAKGEYPDTMLEFRSERCNHCENAPCVRCCPTGASFTTEGGIVLVDESKCIGCAACVESCPYDARFMHPDGYADKCTFCYHLVSEGQNPACVDVCPTKCIYFGDLDDADSEISKIVETRKSKVLLPEAGTNPHIFYLT